MTEDVPIAIVLKGYPRLSETFIAQELLALQEAGKRFAIWSLRRPYDDRSHPMHAAITAPVTYLPEYLHEEPLRVLRSLARARRLRGFADALRAWWRDLRRDLSLNRVRRFGQAAVLANELPSETALLYAHFLHTPCSVTRYAAIMRGLPWGVSAHAKDIWTIPEWEKREKLAEAAFAVTCTATNATHLRALATDDTRVRLVYHGLDLARFPAPPNRDAVAPCFTLLSVGRLIEKKGYGVLLDALALLPSHLDWRFRHIGGGPLAAVLRAKAKELGLEDRISWLGKRDQNEVIAEMRSADLFVLPSRIADDGDRDGLPNVLMEAASQKLPIVSTAVSAIPEFVETGTHGVLVEPDDPAALASAVLAMIEDPATRSRMADAARARLVERFGMKDGIAELMSLMDEALGQARVGHAA
jgi:glycosyltransferase involved in cell wall biosynthesis